MSYKIYSVEDDINISKIISVTLSKQGYDITTFADGESFLEEFSKNKPNMVLLDMMLPGISGKEILTKIRSSKDLNDISIIIISANSMTMDKVEGLDLGADDYISKPFDILELISRVNVQARRNQNKKEVVYEDIVMDVGKMTCVKNGLDISLTKREFAILLLLIKSKGNIITRDTLLKEFWGDSSLETRTIDMHITSLRKKLNDDKIIQTVYGVGYKIS